MKLIAHALLASLAFIPALACGSVVTLEGADSTSTDAGPGLDGSSSTDAATDAATEPAFDASQCPRAQASLPAVPGESYATTAYAGSGTSFALGSSGLRPFRFSPAGLIASGDAAPVPGVFGTLRALPSSNAFVLSEGFSDAATRTVKVFGPGFRELATLTETNARFEDVDREGISSTGQIFYPVFERGTAGVAIHNGGVVCSDCTLAGVADASLYVFREGFLERRTVAGETPGVVVDGKVPVAFEEGAEAPRLVGATSKLLFFTRSYRDSVTVYDRETLEEVPFAWEESEVPSGVVGQPDGTVDLFSLQFGEIAFASHRDGTGKMLTRGAGHAAYGPANPTPCGFWVGSTHFPFAR